VWSTTGTRVLRLGRKMSRAGTWCAARSERIRETSEFETVGAVVGWEVVSAGLEPAAFVALDPTDGPGGVAEATATANKLETTNSTVVARTSPHRNPREADIGPRNTPQIYVRRWGVGRAVQFYPAGAECGCVFSPDDASEPTGTTRPSRWPPPPRRWRHLARAGGLESTFERRLRGIGRCERAPGSPRGVGGLDGRSIDTRLPPPSGCRRRVARRRARSEEGRAYPPGVRFHSSRPRRSCAVMTTATFVFHAGGSSRAPDGKTG
jgi:hypothetical protein